MLLAMSEIEKFDIILNYGFTICIFLFKEKLDCLSKLFNIGKYYIRSFLIHWFWLSRDIMT